MSNLGIAQSEITGASSGGSGSTVTFRGAWSNVTAYSTNDLVTRKGSVWIAVTGNSGQDPYLDNGTNWTLFAEGFNYAGTWSVSTHYNFFDVVTLNNSFYLSVLAGSQTNIGHNPQTDNGTNWVLLDQGFNFLGTWSVGTTYQPYDVVIYQGSTYVSVPGTLNNLGNTPSSTSAFWALLAAAGAVAPRQTFTFNMPSASVTSVQITGGTTLTLTCTNSFTAQGEGTGSGQVNTIYLSGFTNATFLNGQVITVATISGTTITANFTHSNYGPTGDTGTATLSIPTNGVFWTTGATGSTISLAPTFEISRIQCGQATRIELYSGSTFRTSDSSRPATTQPTQFTQHGVILDLNLDGVVAPFTSWVLSPLAYGANDEFDALPAANISAALTNIGGSPTTNGFFITFTWTVEESGNNASPNSDEYVLGAYDATNLPAGVANPTAYFGTDVAPGTAGSLDDEFNAASLNLGRWTWINQGSATAATSKSILDLHDPTTSAADNFRVIAQPIPPSFSLTSVATSSGGVAVYSGTITGGAANAYAGTTFFISGFTTGANNGTFLCTASTAATLTLNNGGAVAETHAATAQAVYQVTAKILVSATAAPANFNSPGGIVITDGTTATNKLIYFGFNNNSAQNLVVNRYTNFTTFSGTTAATLALTWGLPTPLPWVYLRYNDDGTNVQYSYSLDGIVFRQLLSESRTAFLTPAQVGLGLENVNASVLCDLSCDWFRRTL